MTDKPEQELLPCPFCGEKENLGYSRGVVYCRNCGAQVGGSLWNQRAAQSPPVEADKRPIAVGQKWKEVDERVTRVVTVVGIYGDKIALRGPTHRLSYASRARFHGKSGGYKLVDPCHTQPNPKQDEEGST